MSFVTTTVTYRDGYDDAYFTRHNYQKQEERTNVVKAAPGYIRFENRPSELPVFGPKMFDDLQNYPMEQKIPKGMIFAVAPWCGHCNAIKASIHALRKTHKDTVFKVDMTVKREDQPKESEPGTAPETEQEKDIRTKLAVRGYPTILVSDGNGRVYQYEGNRDLKSFQALHKACGFEQE